METEIIGTGENKMKNILKEILSISVYLLLVFCAAYLIVTYVGQRTQVSGSSMETTLSDGDHLIVDKISYRFSDPERFDIIVFPFQYDTDTYYIKRIIGMPGETVQIDESGNIYIDGELLEESYGREVIQNPGRASDPVRLGEDEYFVMGDNRNNSSDSRDPSVGNIHRRDIIGRAFIRIWPSSKFGILKHQ
jgi:signal peptidase I